MGTGDYIALGLIVIIVSVIIIYLIKQKKKGVKCIGCPHGSKCSSCCGCDIQQTNKTD